MRVQSEDSMENKNFAPVLDWSPSCRNYLLDLARNQLVDEGFTPSFSGNSLGYTVSAEKFMDTNMSLKRYVHYLYVIIKIGNEPLTSHELQFQAYINSLPIPKDSPIVIDCIVSRVSKNKLKEWMTSTKLIDRRLW